MPSCISPLPLPDQRQALRHEALHPELALDAAVDEERPRAAHERGRRAAVALRERRSPRISPTDPRTSRRSSPPSCSACASISRSPSSRRYRPRARRSAQDRWSGRGDVRSTPAACESLRDVRPNISSGWPLTARSSVSSSRAMRRGRSYSGMRGSRPMSSRASTPPRVAARPSRRPRAIRSAPAPAAACAAPTGAPVAFARSTPSHRSG